VKLTELVPLALIGTNQHPQASAELLRAPQNPTLAALFGQLHQHSPEQQVLTLAAVLGTQELATGSTVFAPTFSEDAIILFQNTVFGADSLAIAVTTTQFNPDWPEVSPQATQKLRELLANEQQIWVIEWLRHANTNHQRLSNQVLVGVLQYASTRAEVKTQITAGLLGSRGQWLAQCNPAWNALGKHSISVSSNVEVFELGTISERVAWLEAERQRDPDAARERLQQGWAKESGDDRVKLIETLSIQLGPNDEAFLERCLDDRKQDVRKAAIDFLRKLPDSQFVARHVRRASQYIQFTSSTGQHFAAYTDTVTTLSSLLDQATVTDPKKTGEIHITLPEQYDKTWERDGISGKPTEKTIGQKTFWLRQMLEFVPAMFWPQYWGINPSVFLQLVLKHDFSESLIQGMLESLNHVIDDRLMKLLFDGHFIVYITNNPYSRHCLRQFFTGLPSDMQEHILLQLFVAPQKTLDKLEDSDIMRQLTWNISATWSEAFSFGVFGYITKKLTSQNSSQGNWKYNLHQFVTELHPAVLPVFSEYLRGFVDTDGEYFQMAHSALAERQAILDSFEQNLNTS
jgi:hypothetical protein